MDAVLFLATSATYTTGEVLRARRRAGASPDAMTREQDDGRRKERLEVNMALTREDDKPWKTDLARKSAQRREQVVHEVEEMIKKAPSFEDALKQAAELLKKRFARFSGGLGLRGRRRGPGPAHVASSGPPGPDRLGAGGDPLADAAHGTTTYVGLRRLGERRPGRSWA